MTNAAKLIKTGRELRKGVPRASHSAWTVRSDRREAVEFLIEANKGRVADLLPIKYERMSVSPFAFFRGAAPLMARDMSDGPRSGIETQLCGDAHVHNLGAYAAPDGRLTFDINDFDETVPGPFEWDVKRLAVSLVLAGRESEHLEAVCCDAVEEFIQTYCSALKRLAKLPVLQLAKYQLHVKVGPVRDVLRRAERATPEHNLAKLTENHGGVRRFKDTPPLLYRMNQAVKKQVLAALEEYAQHLSVERRMFFDRYTAVDVGFKVVGTGSIGTKDYVVLFHGNGESDPLFLQVKQELASCYTPYLKSSRCRHEGQRVCEGQRKMQGQSDPYLGWTTIEGEHYLVRQLSDHKASLNDLQLRQRGLLEYARVCGEALARGHARTGEAALLSGYCGSGARLARSIAEFASQYARQTLNDYAVFMEEVGSKVAKAVAKA